MPLQQKRKGLQSSRSAIPRPAPERPGRRLRQLYHKAASEGNESGSSVAEGQVPSQSADDHARMIEGLINLGIAKRLEVSQATMGFHASIVLSKPGVDSGTEGVILAVQHQLRLGQRLASSLGHNSPDGRCV
jgi:hypothetical protein